MFSGCQSSRRTITRLALQLVVCCPVAVIASAAQRPAPGTPSTQALARAAEFMKEAQVEFQRGDFTAAAGHFRQVTELVPHDARALFGLGLSLASSGKNQEAHSALLHANRLSPANPEILLALAQLETSLGKLDLARQRLANVEKLRPKDPRIGVLTVQTYLAENQLQAALSKIQALTRSSDDSLLHSQLASLLLKMGAWREVVTEYEWMDQRSSEEAERAMAQGLSLAANSAEFRDLLLNFFQEKKRMTRAVALFQRLTRQAPDNPYFQVGLIQASVMEGNIETAKQELRSLSHRVPFDAKIHELLGRFLLSWKQEELALSQFLRAHRSSLQDPKITLQLAGLQGRAGAYTDAIQTALPVEQQTALTPQIRSAAALLVGTSYMSAGQEKRAIEHLELAIQLMPNLENSYLALSQVYEVLRDSKTALDVLKRGQKKILPSPDYLLNLGNNLLANEDYEGAVTVLSDLIAKHPEQSKAYLPLARSCRLADQPQLGIQTMRRLYELQPQFPMLPVMLAQSLMDEGASGYKPALEELNRAEKATPTDPDIYYLRGKVFLSMARLDEAEAQLRRAIELRPSSPGFHYQLALVYQRMGKEALALQQIENKNHLERVLVPDLSRPN
ncbi:MAG: tetratricopeptide repeat protein [Acidobacteria bacterium]|nr:tetratricopeptide repeat protein [Acidobacteriota bacterium]